jgi:hypothetical protein
MGFFKSIPPISKPWQYYTIDFITDLLLFKDELGSIYNLVLILINRVLKYI